MTQASRPAPLKNILRLGFIEPFRSPGRFLIYIAALLGDASITAASLYLSFSLYSYGPLALLGYFIVRFGFANLFWIPYLFYAFEKFRRTALILTLMGIKVVSLTFFLSYGDIIMHDINFVKGSILGILNVVMSATFWLFHHRLMIEYSSDDNRGNEVSIAEFAINVGALIGAIGGGYSIMAIGGKETLTICFVLMWLAIGIYGMLLYKTPLKQKPYPFFKIYRLVFEDVSRSLNTALYAANHFLLSFLAPVWMAAIGISGLGTGIVLALQSLIRFVASPFVGHLTNKNKADETIIGATIKAAGWLPWIFSQAQILLLPSSVLWFIGNHFYNVGTLSRWYAAKTSAHIGAREICQGTARILMTIIFVPLLFYSLEWFFAGCFMIAVAGIITSKLEQKFLIRD